MTALSPPRAKHGDGSDTSAGDAWPWALASLAIGGILHLAVFREAVRAMLQTWWTSPSFEHGLLVPAVAGVVVWLDRRALARLAPRPWPWALAGSVLAATLAALGVAASTLLLQQLALVLALQALAATVLGRQVTRRIAFALAFLYFAMPFGDVIVPALRDLTAAASVELLSLVGQPATLDGFLIRLPAADYRIAEACAGLRFFLVGIAIGLLAAKLFLRSWRRWAVFLTLAAFVPIAANIVRATAIILLSEKVLLPSNSAWLHLTYGTGFNAVVITVLIALAFALRDAPVAPATARSVGGRYRPAALLFLAGLATALPALGLALGAGEAAPSAKAVGLSASDVVSGWQAVARGDDGWRPRVPGADAELLQAYANGQARADLYIAVFKRQRQGAEIVSDANRLTAMRDWQQIGRRFVPAAIGATDVSDDAVISRAGGKRRLSLRFYWVDGTYTASAILAKWRQAAAALLRRDPAAAVIVVSTSYGNDPELAAATLRDFVGKLAPFGTDER